MLFRSQALAGGDVLHAQADGDDLHMRVVLQVPRGGFCDSPASRNLAADACLKALALDRRERLLGRRPALFMAAALYNIERQTF